LNPGSSPSSRRLGILSTHIRLGTVVGEVV